MVLRAMNRETQYRCVPQRMPVVVQTSGKRNVIRSVVNGLLVKDVDADRVGLIFSASSSHRLALGLFLWAALRP